MGVVVPPKSAKNNDIGVFRAFSVNLARPVYTFAYSAFSVNLARPVHTTTLAYRDPRPPHMSAHTAAPTTPMPHLTKVVCSRPFMSKTSPLAGSIM